MTYTPPIPTDCSDTGGFTGLTIGDRLHQVPQARVIAADQIRTISTPPQPQQKKFTGSVPGMFGATCFCEELAEPPAVLEASSGAGKSLHNGPLGAQARLSADRSVWVVCTFGALWAAVVAHSPYGVGPWQKLLDLPVAPLSACVRVLPPAVAALSPTRIAVGWWNLVDNGGPGSSWPVTDYGQPFDVVGNSFVSAGSVQTSTPTDNYVPQGSLRTMDSGMAVGLPWPTPNREGSISVFGVVSLSSTGKVGLHTGGLATGTNGLLGQPSWLATDPVTGNHIYVTIEAVGAVGVPMPVAVVGYLMTHSGTSVTFSHRTVLFGPVSLPYGGMFDYTDPLLITLIAPVCRISSGRFLIAVRAAYDPTAAPDGSWQRTLLIVAASSSGLSVQASFPYPTTDYGIKWFDALQEVEDNHVVGLVFTEQPFASEPSPPGPDLETFRGFVSVNVLADSADITGAFAPGSRTQTSGAITGTEFGLPAVRQMAFSQANDGLALAAWNVSPVLNVPGVYNTCDALGVPAEWRMHAELCLLTPAGRPVTDERKARLSARSYQ